MVQRWFVLWWHILRCLVLRWLVRRWFDDDTFFDGRQWLVRRWLVCSTMAGSTMVRRWISRLTMACSTMVRRWLVRRWLVWRMPIFFPFAVVSSTSVQFPFFRLSCIFTHLSLFLLLKTREIPTIQRILSRNYNSTRNGSSVVSSWCIISNLRIGGSNVRLSLHHGIVIE